MLALEGLLRRAARSSPGATAVAGARRRVTYRTLDREAEEVARFLSSRGIGPGDRVGVLAGKTPEAVAAIHGVLRAGAAYVPLDPRDPPRRSAFKLRDSGARALAADGDACARLDAAGELPAEVEALFVLSGRPPASRRGRPGTAVRRGRPGPGPAPRRAAPDDLAYILYTSGSTGTPKGVMISRRAAGAFTAWAGRQFRLRADDRVAGVAPFQFDLSVFDLFATAAAGAALHPFPDELSAFPAELARFVARRRATVLYSVPFVLGALPEAGREGFGRSLRLVLFAGEPFAPSRLARLMRAIPGARFYNLYGPTETNVCAFHRVDAPPREDSSVPIGRACAHARLFVAGAGGRAAARGRLGELLVAGDSVMEGYRGRPARFARGNFDGRGPARWYRTGDFVRERRDGVLEFHGRRDDLVKRGGQRVALGEIEAVLESAPTVAEAAVVFLAESDGPGRLVAFARPAPRRVLDAAAAREHCAARLPRHMIPEIVPAGPGLPRTANGKLDRAALAARARGER